MVIVILPVENQVNSFGYTVLELITFRNSVFECYCSYLLMVDMFCLFVCLHMLLCHVDFDSGKL